MTGDAGGDMLSWDESVFRDESVFEIDHVPETFRHRESQLESLKYALRPAVRGSRPLNIVRGPPGTGKTTAVQKLFGELSARTDVRTVRVNCQVDSTRYAVFSRLFEGIFDYEPPSSGISFKKLFGQITDRLVEEDDVLVVALDDVNYLFYENEASDTLYSLLRAHEAHSGAKIGVIVVSSDLGLDVIDDLDTRVQSVFRPEEVYFPVYGAAEIYDILFRAREARVSRRRHRRRRAGAHRGLDRRERRPPVGIDLLRRAGLNAEMRASKTIDEEDVESAYDKSKHVHLRALAPRALGVRAPSSACLRRTTASAPGRCTRRFTRRRTSDYTRYSEIINKLDQLGVIDAEYADVEGRGRSRELSLAYEAETVLDRLE